MAFVRWEEKVISNDKGKRFVHYYLKDEFGKRFLAVVGKEKSLRHMSYAVTAQFSTMMAMSTSSSYNSSFCSSSPSSALDFGGGSVGCLKWKSRRELIDWLSSIVSDSAPCTSFVMGDGFSDDEDEPATVSTSKGLASGKMGHLSKDFSWLGSAWNCKKKRKHYRSFSRNGITISVHDFVHIMSEDYKRLVAYVEDLYEDTKANKMVVVRWFHKVDEVGGIDFDLPPDINEREIFSSVSVQVFSIECIDGLAAVLSAQDFDKFHKEQRFRCCTWEPYLCRRQIENENAKPFDITKVQGYWSQELLRFMYATTQGTLIKVRLKLTNATGPGSVINPNSEKSRLKSGENKSRSTVVPRERHVRATSAPTLLRKELLKQKLLQQQKHLAPGCHVEVLSQDSGIRGCWFRCVVLKKHHDKVKVRYLDVQDGDDAGNLEEWVLASRVASPDKLGIRLCGRPVIRPDPSQSQDIKLSCNSLDIEIGSIVDAWWLDGWWEGIVIQKELEQKIGVYFPGEQKFSTFVMGDLRQSQEWIGSKWNPMKVHQDLATSLLSEHDVEACKALCTADKSTVETGASVPNLFEFCHLDSLKWSSSRKRKRARELGTGKLSYKLQCGSGSSSSSGGGSKEEVEAASNNNACEEFLPPKSLTTVVENEYCKIGGGDPLLVAPMTLCSSLVMSQ